MVAYVKPDGLWLRRLDRTSADRIVARSGIGSLAWSPSADALAFFDGQDVSIVRTDGSAERTVWRPTPQVRFFRSDVGLAWSGNAVYVPTWGGIMRVSVEGGDTTIVAPWGDTPGVGLYRYPIVLNDGQVVLVNPGITGQDKY